MSFTPDSEVSSRDELVAFVRNLHQDYLRRGNEWENQSLDHFLAALDGCLAALVPQLRQGAT
ncbi:hypothetical protein AB0L04_13495 [Streptomyces glaucescens]|uniref:DUF7660 family protein n=1 Tax=Streptomyces glaucescens TaxID=1907 RepID=UPI00345074AF